MAIPDSIIDQIRERVDIVELIGQYVPLKKAGRNFKGNCPFHNEKTPSFMVSTDKQIYHCFGCGAGGNVFSFLMRYEGLEFPEAVESLAQRAGVVLPRSEQSGDAGLSQQLYRINEIAAQYFQANLLQNKTALEYVRSRGVGDETIKKLRVGFANDAWEGLIAFFKKHGIAAPMLEKAGLAIANDRGGYFDRFRKRVMFPILDLRERIIGFGGRVLDDTQPKYMNSPETAIYTKGRNLYGLNFGKEEIRREGFALIVEGYLDFIVPYQAGVHNIIATLGTALTVDQVRLIKRFAKTVVTVYDPDAAGEAASLRNLDIFLSEDVNVYVAELTEGYDPDSFIRKFGAEEFFKIVKSSKNLFDYKLDKLYGKYDHATTYGKTAIVGEMLPTIVQITNAVLKSELIKKLAQRLSVDEESIKEELKKTRPAYEAQAPRPAPAAASQALRRVPGRAELMIVALLFGEPKLIAMARERMKPEELRDERVQSIVAAIYAMHAENLEVQPARLISRLGNGNDAAVTISEAVNMLETLANIDKARALIDCMETLKRDATKGLLLGIQDAIRAAHTAGDAKKVEALVLEYNDLMKAGKAYDNEKTKA